MNATRSWKLRLVAVGLVGMLFGSLFSGILSISGEKVPPNGDWIVTGVEIRSNETIVLSGNLTIQSGGKLTLSNVTLIMNCTYNGTYHIEVQNGGEFYIYNNSNITAYNSNYHYMFWVRDGSKFEMRDSELSECGWNNSNRGLIINADGIIIDHSTISNNWDGIYLSFSSDNLITNCSIHSNDNNGIFLSTNALYNTITNCHIFSNNLSGISSASASNNSIVNCNISSNEYYGIIIGSYSSNSTISKCNVYSNKNYGIFLHYSLNCIITDTQMWDNKVRNLQVWGDLKEHYNHTISTSNLANGKPVYYFFGLKNTVIQNLDTYHITLAGCDNVTLMDSSMTYGDGIHLHYITNSILNNCHILLIDLWGIYLHHSTHNIILNSKTSTNTGYGITISSSANNSIVNCSTENNYYGILFYNSSDNTIRNCNVSSNNYCIYLHNSSNNNSIYHNTFTNNTLQPYDNCTNFWDNGYPSGGNYWGDYTGIDFYSGVNQDEPGSDGIGDIPYNISGGSNQDRYPLMSPWNVTVNFPPTASFTYSPTSPTTNDVVQFNDTSTDPDGTIVSWSWNFGDGNTSTLQNPTHQYSEAGNYSVSLTVTDDDGASDTYTCNITVVLGPVHNLDKDTYYQTIQAGVDDADSGNRIFVSAGTYYENVIIDKTLTLMGEDRNTTIIDGSGSGDVVYISADWVNVSGFGVRNGNYSGIYLSSSSNSNIANCICYNNGPWAGIYLHSSSNNTITNCVCYNNTGYGIRLYDSSNNNQITSCTFYDNKDFGIQLSGSSNNNTISRCICYNSGYDGIQLGYHSNNNQISNCILYNNPHGILLYNSSNNNITNCTIYNNTFGIDIFVSLSNTITNCAVYNNGNGIYFDSSSNNNRIYHNNFINNTINAYDDCSNFWDNGYPSGGNYWSDYTGSDLYSGVNQDEPGSDGIGDTPYNISGGSNQDRYPLMSPWNVTVNFPPMASFTYSPASPTTNTTIQFIDTSYDPDGIVVAWYWDFGDGNTSTLQNPTHLYFTPGNYTVTLTVWDNDNATDSSCSTIMISAVTPNQPPIVNITYPEDGQSVNGTVTISGIAYDPDSLLTNITPQTNSAKAWSPGYVVYILTISSNASVDYMDLEAVANVTTGWIVEFLNESGVPYEDTNGNGKPNIALVAAGIDYYVYVKISVPDSVANGTAQTHTIYVNASDGSTASVTVETICDMSACSEPHGVVGRAQYLNGTPADGAFVLMLNTRTGEAHWDIVGPTGATNMSGYYSIDCSAFPSGWKNGDMLKVMINDGTHYGIDKLILDNSTVYQWMNITLDMVGPSKSATQKEIASQPGVAVQLVEIRIDNGSWQLTSGTTSWLFDWDTTTISNGNHTIYARAYDGVIYSEVKSVNVYVNNPAINQPPVVNITYPMGGDIINGTVTVTGTASDPDAIKKTYVPNGTTVQFVEIKIDSGSWQLASGTTTWSFAWNTTTVSNGWHTIYARAYDGIDYSEIKAVSVYVNNVVPNQPPSAYIDSISPNPATEGQTVTFTGQGTDPDGSVVAYNWRSDIDGELSTEASFSTSSLSVGTHTIYFKVQDNSGAWSSEVDTTLVIEPFVLPTLTVTVNANPTTVDSGGTVAITVIVTDGTNAVTGAIINLASNYGGSFSSVTDNGDGTYTVTFTAPSVTDQTICRITATASKVDCNSGSGYVDVTVNPVIINQSPTADFTYSPSSPTVNEVVQFTDLSNDSDGTIVAWYWDFGDDKNSTLQNPTHQYAVADDYTVALTVTDNDGANDTCIYVITISAVNQPPTAVTLYNPTNITTSSMTLEWSENNDADFAKYELYQSTTTGTLGTLIHTITDQVLTTYTVTSLFPDTTYYFIVRVVDTGNLYNASNQVSGKTLKENQPPTVYIDFPIDNQVVNGTVTIAGTAGDTDGTVQSVELKIDTGEWQVVNGTTIWNFVWDTSTVSNGLHTIYARAYDGFDYSSISSVNINVNNVVPNQPPVANFAYIMGSEILQGAEINITLRVSGKPGAVINLTLKENNISIANLSVTRTQGSPNEASLYFTFNASRIYELVVERVSGGGGSSVWVIINCAQWNITIDHMVFNQGEGTEGSQTLNLTLILDYTTRTYGLVVFDATQSKDPDGVIQQYLWSFGDGSSGVGVLTQHNYSVGDYTVTLTVIDNNNATNTAYANITILDFTELYVSYSRQRAARIDCPADLLITDKTNTSRYIGYKEGILANNITGATAITIGDTEIYLIPLTGDYTYNVSGTGVGTYTFKVYEPGDFEPGDFNPGDFNPGDFSGRIYEINSDVTSGSLDEIKITADGDNLTIKADTDKFYSVLIKTQTQEFAVYDIPINRNATHTLQITNWSTIGETDIASVNLTIDEFSDGIVDRVEELWNNFNIADKFKPDLTVTLAVSNYNPAPGENISVYITLGNIGEGPARNIKIKFLVDNVLCEDYEVALLWRDGTVEITFYWTAKEGTHELSILVDPEHVIAELNENNNGDFINIEVKGAGAVPIAPIASQAVAIVGSVAAVSIVIAAALAGTEVGKYGFFSLFGPLFVKRKGAVLDQFTRGRIYEHIKLNPGAHYNSIKSSLKLGNGTLSYHLTILEKEGYIKSETEGMYKRFYSAGEVNFFEKAHLPLSDLQQEIVDRVKANPGISQRELITLIGKSQQAISYNIKVLLNTGLLRTERKGKEKRLYLEKDYAE